jgi:hypothetical protein
VARSGRTSDKPEGGRPGRSDVFRRLFAGFVFLAITTGVVATYWPGGPRVCRDQIAQTGSLVSVCRPVGLDDAILIGLLLLLAIVFLLPDISEFGIAGLLSMKLRRRIWATERKADAAEDKADRAQADVMYLALATPTPTSKVISQAANRTTAKSERPAPQAPSARLLSSERQDAEQRFLADSSQIDRYLRLPPFRSAQSAWRMIEQHPEAIPFPADRLDLELRLEGVPPRAARDVLEAVRAWQVAYESELSEFARVRTVFAHYPERLSDDELHAAVNLAEELLSAVRHRIASLPAAPPSTKDS